MNLYEFFIGCRFLKTRRNRIISVNAALSVIIVCIGVFSLVVVVSVMSGFQSAIKDKILDIDSHIFITNSYFSNEQNIKNYEKLSEDIMLLEEVRSVYPCVEGMAILDFRKPVAVKGMGGKNNIPSSMKKFIKNGQEYRKRLSLAEGQSGFTGGKEVFIGVELADQYNIDPGDKIELIIARGMSNNRTSMQPAKEVFKVAGFFKTRNYDLDSGLVVMSLRSAQNLYDIGDTVTCLRVIVSDVYRSEKIARKINLITGFRYNIRTTESMNENLFYALRLEKLIMIIILFIVILSALIAIMGTLVMIVSEKKRSVGILKSMGARPASITTIFVLEGFIIGTAGSSIGAILGLAAAFNINAIIVCIENIINYFLGLAHKFTGLADFDPVSLIPKHVYYMDYIPVKINPDFIIILILVTVFFSSLAAVLPSLHASKLQPVEAIRYE